MDGWNKGTDVPKDPKTGAVVKTSLEAAASNNGNLFGFSVYNNNVDIAGPLEILYKVGAKNVHLKRFLQSIGGTVQIIVYKDPTIAAEGDGDAVDIYNQDNVSANTPLVTVFTSPTTTDDGDQCFETSTMLGSAANVTLALSTLTDDASRVLTANTNYLVRVSAIADNTIVDYAVQFYED
jgi:hypothetical protein